MTFEWDPRKAAANARKHGIQFADAVLVLEDEFAITLPDDVRGEERWVTIGMDALARILTVVYTWRGDTLRVISARPATAKERGQYLEKS
ncbi:MAG: BrnT family toxin [Acidobacteria bacterium]|nr:BrnT family toxin [Acidobacteriota bacterium]